MPEQFVVTEDSGEGSVRMRRDPGPYRYRLLVFFFVWLPLVFLCCYSVLTVLPPIRNLIATRQRVLDTQLQALTTVPELEQKIASLDQHVKLITTDSVDARVKTIESALHVGNVRPEQIASLEDTRRELESLKGYMFSDPKALVDFKQLQTDYRTLMDKQALLATKEDLKSQIGTTNNLIYLSWAIFAGLLALALALKPRAAKPQIPTKPVSQPPSPPAPEHQENE